jgi:CDP-glycerol glycerophosphotransferase (TagB/SpsB family)
MRLKLIKLFKYIGSLALAAIDLATPKINNQYCIYVTRRTSWDANSQCIYALLSKQPSVNCKIIYSCNESKRGLPKKKSRKVTELKGLAYLLTSKVIFIDHAILPGIRKRNRTIVNLWHGIPIKSIRYFNRQDFNSNYLRNQSKQTSLLICSSKIDRLAMSASFQLTPDKVPITGLPRNDLLVNPFLLDDQLSFLKNERNKLKEQIGNRTLILYAPTYRGKSEDKNTTHQFTDEFQSELTALLVDYNAVFATRSHKFSTEISFSNSELQAHHINASQDVLCNTSILLSFTDILITDFSSIWVDFLLTQRPILGFFPDKDTYIKDRGCVYDFDEIFPSSQAKSEQTLLDNLSQTLSSPKALTKDYKRALKMFHAYNDGENTSRVLDRILKAT